MLRTAFLTLNVICRENLADQQQSSIGHLESIMDAAGT
jgi:hypothetical protein